MVGRLVSRQLICRFWLHWVNGLVMTSYTFFWVGGSKERTWTSPLNHYGQVPINSMDGLLKPLWNVSHTFHGPAPTPSFILHEPATTPSVDRFTHPLSTISHPLWTSSHTFCRIEFSFNYNKANSFRMGFLGDLWDTTDTIDLFSL